jgi:uncharacterized protein (TIGR02594 family)
MAEPRWLTAARAHIGVREIKGPKHNPTIMGWIKRLTPKKLGIAVNDDETPWCGTFMAAVMSEAGFATPPIAVRASSWGAWGTPLIKPSPGAVMVFTRQGGGHVGLYVGEDATAYHVLGGNQSDSVSITRIAKSRLTTARWPPGLPVPKAGTVVLDGSGQRLSVNER